MAVLAIFKGVGISADMYSDVRREVNWESQHPAGGIFHAASVGADGNLHVADVWASAEAMQSFVEERLMPAMQKLQMPPPEVNVYEAIHIDAYAAVEQFILR